MATVVVIVTFFENTDDFHSEHYGRYVWFYSRKKLFLVTFRVDKKGLSVERCIIIIIIIIIIIFNKKPYLNETISTSISSEFPEYTFRICKG